MSDLHKIQMLIIKELLYKPNFRFRDLNISGLTTDHFSYHINTLVEQGLVEKLNSRYCLSIKGKKFAGSIDTDSATLEKQPKVSVLIITEKSFSGTKKYLWQRRTKEPYFGYWGFFTGKVRFGETVQEACARELKEESGLEANIRHLFVLHEMVYSFDGDILEDKYFNIMYCTDIQGKLLEKTLDGENKWLTEKQLRIISPQYHNEIEIFDLFKDGQSSFYEKKYFIKSF